MESFIHFFFRHLEKIIYICIGVICLLSAFVVWWQVFGRKGLKTGDAPEIDLSSIETMLTKILGQTHNAISATTSAETAAGSAGAVTLDGIVSATGQPITDVPGVKKELEERAKIIEGLQKEVAGFKDQTPSTELLAKIKNLEARLVEYEIIEDDIADLSQYKEENAKLKKELEAIKRADPKMVDQFADAVAGEAKPGAVATATEGAQQADAEADAMVAAMAAATAESDAVSAPAPAASPSAPAAEPDLAAAVAAAQSQVDNPAPSASAPLAGTEDSATPAAEGPATGADAKGDIFSEFSGGASEEDPLAALGDIDPDRMLDELKDLNADMSVGAEALDEAPDMDKMADEAAKLDKKKEA